MMYRSHFPRNYSESSYPELERHYYKKSLQQPFTENEEEIAERRYLLKSVYAPFKLVEIIDECITFYAVFAGQVLFRECIQRGCPMAQKDTS